MSDSHRHRGLFDPEEGNREGNPEEGDPEEGRHEEGDPEEVGHGEGDHEEDDLEEGDPEKGEPEEGDPEKGDPEANPEDDDVWQLSQIYKKRAYQKGREAATKYLHM